MKDMITSIEVSNASQGLCCGASIVQHVLKMHRTGEIIHSLYTGMKDKPAERFTYEADPKSMESFFRLFTDIQSEWKDDYDVYVLDGWRWECLIRHEGGTVRKVTGTVEPPPYGKLLSTMIRNLADFTVEPWLFR